MTNQEFINEIAEYAVRDMQKTGVLASVTIAQSCLEAGFGTTDLAVKANNVNGLKCDLSGNTWETVWDKKSRYTKNTKEQKKDGDRESAYGQMVPDPRLGNLVDVYG